MTGLVSIVHFFVLYARNVVFSLSVLMRTGFWLILFLATLVFPGCRNTPRITREIEQMGSQRRELEDQIYDLQYEYDKQADEVERLKQQNRRLTKQLEQQSRASQTQVETEGAGGPALIDLSAGEQGNRIAPDSIGITQPILPISHSHLDEKPQQSSTLIESLEINKLRTVLRDGDSNRLIDTVVLHISPRDHHGKFTAHAEDVDVVIRNRTATGELVGQWKISQVELKRILNQSMYRSTIPIELKLAKELDETAELFLDVRFGTRGVRSSSVLTSRGISTSRSHWTPYR